MESCPKEELLNDNTKLESKVVLALSRIPTMKKSARTNGVSLRQIVNYLNANYSCLDGDVESQVMTALLSCVKTGHVCALDNGKYLLPNPGATAIISKCFARASHGPKCSCTETIGRMSKTFQKICCTLKAEPDQTKKARKSSTKPKPAVSSGRSKKRTVCKAKPTKCARRQQQLLEARDSFAMRKGTCGAEMAPQCGYCLEMHEVKKKDSVRLCRECHRTGTGFVAPYNMFSPREELLRG